MEIIKQGDPGILQIIVPVERMHTTYKVSQCLIREDTPDGVILGNTLTGEIAFLSNEEKKTLEHLTTADEDKLELLIKRGYIIPQIINEQKRILQLREVFQMRAVREEYINNYKILPTTRCNARCFYCYQRGTRQEDMTEKTAEALVQFITEHRRGKSVRLSWFGGEPTLETHCIDYICRRMNELDIPFMSSMISNAYLFDEAMVEKAKTLWRLRRIQITLDGTAEVYNRTKAYIQTTDNPFERVMHNIELLLSRGINVAIRLNLGAHNAEDLNMLVEELFRRFKSRKNLQVYAHKLDSPTFFAPIQCGRTGTSDLSKLLSDLERSIESKGWKHADCSDIPKLIPWSCMADNPHTIKCAPDGTFGRCDHFPFESGLGSVTRGTSDGEEAAKWSFMIFAIIAH